MRTVEWLRSQKHDAVHLRERNQQRFSDAAILNEALREKRVLLTMDLDFGYLLAASGMKMPSVVIFRLENETSMNVNARLKDVLDRSLSALEEGAVISVGENHHRVRYLPIQKQGRH